MSRCAPPALPGVVLSDRRRRQGLTRGIRPPHTSPRLSPTTPPHQCLLLPCHSVKCTFILVKQNQRVTVPGMVGWSLLKTAQHHGLPVNGIEADSPYDYVTFGEGPAGPEDHVVVQREYFDKTGPIGWQELNLLEDMDPENRAPTCATLSLSISLSLSLSFPP